MSAERWTPDPELLRRQWPEVDLSVPLLMIEADAIVTAAAVVASSGEQE